MNILLIYGFLIPIFGIIEYVPVVFLLLIIRPLWILSKKRIVLNMIFSKACASILLQICVSIHELVFNKTVKNVPTYMLFWFLYIIRFHVPILALNRLHAVFWPFKYEKWWKSKRCLALVCLFIWLAAIPPAIVFILNILSDFSWIPDLELRATILQTIMGIIWPALCYILVFIKVVMRRKKGVEKDMLRMCIVFSFSMVPYIFWLGLYLMDQFMQNAQFNQQTEYTRVEYSAHFLFIYNALMLLITINNTLINIADDIALICLCKDYRKLIRRQMVDIFHLITCRQFYNADAQLSMVAGTTIYQHHHHTSSTMQQVTEVGRRRRRRGGRMWRLSATTTPPIGEIGPD